jgi:His-Xaa-Ser system radical SAM maturase HxsB
LDAEEFDGFSRGFFAKKTSKFEELEDKFFIMNKNSSVKMIERYKSKNPFLFFKGPSLHIIVLTLRCNHKCVYCQASSVAQDCSDRDLDMENAKKIVDFIFESPNEDIAIEFQGGEPTLNWPVLEFIVKYARELNMGAKRNIEFRLVTNFSAMDEERLKFIFKNLISVSTSLDGPKKLHDSNRVYLKGKIRSSYEVTAKWLEKILREYNLEKNKASSSYKWQPGAITTISRRSLGYPYEIVDEYKKWGFENVFLRPINSFGVAKNVWDRIGYSPEEYIEFYKKAVSYIIKLNKKGEFFRELYASNMLVKILTDSDPNYTELRSPCGAGIGQLLYNYDGKIYTCDEGRMIEGDEFMIGDVRSDSYKKVIESPKIKSVCVASCMENLTCDLCVFKPYCGVCPIHNYVNTGGIFASSANSDRCKINKAILEFLFEELRNPETKKIFMKWATRGNKSKSLFKCNN